MSNFKEHFDELMKNPEFRREYENRVKAEVKIAKQRIADAAYQSHCDRENYMDEVYGYDGPFGA